MKPIRADDANLLLSAPEGEEENVEPMWVRVTIEGEVQCTTSTWLLDEEELAKILHGRNLKITIWGRHPPIRPWID